MLAVFSLFLVMFGLIVTLDKTTYNRRYKLCKTWIIIGGVYILSDIALIYAYC